jgi:CHAT domain-containing protein
VALTSPLPMTPPEAQKLVRPNEVLVVLALVPEEAFAWVITPGKVRVARLSATPDTIRDLVAALRCGLDAAAWRDDRAEKCRALLKADAKGGPATDDLPFDLRKAHRLYQALFSSIEDDILSKHILLVVPPGPLATFPFSVLVTEAPAISIPNSVGGYRRASWLGKRQGITMLPSVSSLRALRELAKTSRASRRFLGIGNPLLEGPQDDPQWGNHFRKLAQASANRQRCSEAPGRRETVVASRKITAFGKLFRGASADIEAVRGLAPLPETADELCEVGRRLGVPESEILLGARATEAALKDLSDRGRLAAYSILHFATHGALAGEVRGSAEAGLVLTPPSKGTSDAAALGYDDGFLTVSEISALRLDADWVVLSACNTAGPAGEGADALSGLASAFFHAGARALLVSHWEVGSEAAVKLTTRAFQELLRRKTTRAEALRASMTELIERGPIKYAHPSQWAPFALVGEGGR